MKLEEPIVEKIAQWLLDAIKEITIGNGYHQTLDVYRPEEIYIDYKSINDLTSIISQSDGKNDGKTTQSYKWAQTFDIYVYFLALVSGVSMDNRINWVLGDIHKRIGIETGNILNKGSFCNSLAYKIELLPWEIFMDEEINATVIKVPISIFFTVDKDNPYIN